MNDVKRKKQVCIVYAIYFIAMILFCGVRILSAQNAIPLDNYYVYELVYALLIQIGIMVVIPISIFYIFMPKKQHILQKTLHFHKIKPSAIAITFVIGIILFFMNIGVASFFNGLISLFGWQTPLGFSTSPMLEQYTFSSFLFELMMTAVLPAFCEEILHRGILLHGIQPIGYRKAIVISSVLFGLMHMSITKVFYAAILGLVIGFLVVMTKSIWVGIILHFTNNALNVYLSYASVKGWFGASFYDVLNSFLTSSNVLISIVAMMSLIVVLVFLLIYCISKLYQKTTLSNVNTCLKTMVSKEDLQDQQTAAMIQNMIKTQTTLNVEYSLSQNPIDIVLPKEQNTIKPTLKENIFLIGAIVLVVLINLSTFIWGLF